MTTDNLQKHKGFSIAGMVCGIVGVPLALFCVPVGLVGLILGIIGLIRANGSPETHGGKGMAITGIAIGAIATMVNLLSPVMIMLPALGKARQAARTLKTKSQLDSIAFSLSLYSEDYNGALPPADADWAQLLIDHGMDPELLISPFPEDYDPSFYYVPASTYDRSSGRVLLYASPELPLSKYVVVYHNLQSELVEDDFYLEIIDGLTLEDGTPWTPHRFGN